jgi:hypothetical protein
MANGTIKEGRMNWLDLLRKISDAAKKHNDVDLIQNINSLQLEILEKHQEVNQLKQQIEELSGKLKIKEILEFRQVGDCNYYFKEGDEVPFCPKCFESNEKLIHLSNSEPWSGGIRRRCVACNEVYFEKPTGSGSHRTYKLSPWS